MMERYRIHSGLFVYFFTFRIVEWLPVFISEYPCKVFTESLNYCSSHKSLGVHSFVLMLTHIHAVMFDRDSDSDQLKETMSDMRKFTGRQLADYCERELPWYYTVIMRQNSGEDRDRRFWHPTIHAEAVISEKFLQQKVDYLHDNPVRKGLVKNPEDWRFSSARFWLTGSTDCDVELCDLQWD